VVADLSCRERATTATVNGRVIRLLAQVLGWLSAFFSHVKTASFRLATHQVSRRERPQANGDRISRGSRGGSRKRSAPSPFHLQSVQSRSPAEHVVISAAYPPIVKVTVDISAPSAVRRSAVSRRPGAELCRAREPRGWSSVGLRFVGSQSCMAQERPNRREQPHMDFSARGRGPCLQLMVPWLQL
jgi:hypothetical protein